MKQDHPGLTLHACNDGALPPFIAVSKPRCCKGGRPRPETNTRPPSSSGYPSCSDYACSGT